MGLIDKTVWRAIRESAAKIGEGIVIDPEQITALIRTVIDDSVERIGKRLHHDSTGMLIERRQLHKEFVDRNRQRWADGFDLLETLIVTSLESGEAFARHHSRTATRRQDHRMYVLIGLHARACLLSGEVLCLMVNGYADGAHARWRALHEVAVTATFLSMHSIETSEQYLAHEYTERRRAMDEYQLHCQTLGYRPFSEREVRRIKRLRDAFVERFGDAFDKPYGWAAQALGIGKKNVTLSDLEQHIGLEHMRPWYRFASHRVHAGPIGLHATLGLTGAQEGANLAGPSNSGMADPGYQTAIALHQVTAALFSQKPSADEVIAIEIMLRMIHPLADAFMKGHRKRGPRHTAASRRRQAIK